MAPLNILKKYAEMKVAILHGYVPEDARKDELDVLAEVEVVNTALRALGHEVSTIPFSFNLEEVIANLQAWRPEIVFNMVESLNGFGQFIYFAPTVLDFLRIPYTGAQTNAMYVTTNKVLTKEHLRSAGIPTPAWQTAREISKEGVTFQPPYMVKPVWEDASVGVDDRSFVTNKSKLLKILREQMARYGECFVESYISGREFNLSLLGGLDLPEVLPPAEMIFKDFSPGNPQIVGYRAKWEENSSEYFQTIRNFKLPGRDAGLIDRLRSIALQCWQTFELNGYARVDFRVDDNGMPWVLEINANPCISPGSGFAAAADEAGLSFETVVARIIKDGSGGRLQVR
jgi:D-alanine-D-alanine ligase